MNDFFIDSTQNPPQNFLFDIWVFFQNVKNVSITQFSGRNFKLCKIQLNGNTQLLTCDYRQCWRQVQYMITKKRHNNCILLSFAGLPELQSQNPDMTAPQHQEGEENLGTTPGWAAEEPWRVKPVGGASGTQLECVHVTSHFPRHHLLSDMDYRHEEEWLGDSESGRWRWQKDENQVKTGLIHMCWDCDAFL